MLTSPQLLPNSQPPPPWEISAGLYWERPQAAEGSFGSSFSNVVLLRVEDFFFYLPRGFKVLLYWQQSQLDARFAFSGWVFSLGSTSGETRLQMGLSRMSCGV